MLRRDVLGLIPALGVTTCFAAPASTAAGGEQGAFKFRAPKPEFLYECDVTLLEAQDFGATIEGTRRIIPITGGHFEGPKMRGTVVSGGADWNLARRDGGGSVDADYYLRTDDGVTMRIVNRGVGDVQNGPPPQDPATGELFFMFTTPTIEAPTGKYDWLNRSVLVGTLGARRDARNAVLIRVFRLI